MSAQVIIPRERTYKLPEGRFHSEISGVVVKPGKNCEQNNCYVHFIPQIRGMERYECCARAIFSLDLSSGSALRRFLEKFMGREFFNQHSGESINLDQLLRGKRCEIELAHGSHDPKYDWPLVNVVEVEPVEQKGGCLN